MSDFCRCSWRCIASVKPLFDSFFLCLFCFIRVLLLCFGSSARLAFLLNFCSFLKYLHPARHFATCFWKVQYKQRLLFSEVFCHGKAKCQIRAAGISPIPFVKPHLFFHIWCIVIRLQFPWFPYCLIQKICSKILDTNNRQAALRSLENNFHGE